MSGLKRRIALVKAELKNKKLDALFVSDETNVSYLSGFTGHDSMLLVTRRGEYCITDSRYTEEARRTAKGFEVRLVETSVYDTVAVIARKNRLRRVGFESMAIPFGAARRLVRRLGGAAVPVPDMVERIRSVKSAEEIGRIRNSIALNRRVFDRLIGAIKPGVPEDRVAGICEKAFIDAGAHAAFEPIVACGARAAMPHARPTASAIKNNSFVMIDIGCSLGGYCSDMTRMVMFGRVSGTFKTIYHVVRAAQEKAIAAIRPGVEARRVDAAARDHIAGAGFGGCFGHSLGHGVGMKVHELPGIGRSSRMRLEQGMVFTVEPAIYVPGFGGVRIEDMVLVTKAGCEVLTR